MSGAGSSARCGVGARGRFAELLHRALTCRSRDSNSTRPASKLVRWLAGRPLTARLFSKARRALLAVEGPAPATTSDESSCDVADNRCKAKGFERQAAQASSASQRALYLQAAYRSYMGLYKAATSASSSGGTLHAGRTSTIGRYSPGVGKTPVQS
ncbi:hypothetical protein SAMN02745121_09008 [Nannocystis exedens]|uniref:Uncharacterized protein n=1 Tax=Nannocystis exedens TaxID=54 RepID=A0A1I2IWR9_9BACT|nr:hypothetical protein NAEX_06579 [Nannocystis exedens]SFF46148.1 hypothetical protein SAMN02745121_09008 [Nannocystis exedens]